MKTEQMYNLYLEGFSLEQVGKSFGVTRQSVYDRFKRAKLEIRPKKYKPFIIVDDHKFTINKNGYYESTTIDGLTLHLYIWQKHNGELPIGYELHHKDCNKLNNDISNLQKVTPSEHQQIHVELRNGSPTNKKIRCVETGEIYPSISSFAKLHNQHPTNISRYYIDGGRKFKGLTYEKID